MACIWAQPALSSGLAASRSKAVRLVAGGLVDAASASVIMCCVYVFADQQKPQSAMQLNEPCAFTFTPSWSKNTRFDVKTALPQRLRAVLREPLAWPAGALSRAAAPVWKFSGFCAFCHDVQRRGALGLAESV